MHCCAGRGFYLTRQKSARNEIIIHEEGLAHRLFTLFGYRGGHGDRELLIRLADLTPKPDLIIWTRCPSDLVVQRLNSRARKTPDRLVGLSEAEAARVLTEAEPKLELGLRTLEKRGARLMQLRTDDGIEGFAEQFPNLFGVRF
jgi:hypothetical protein